MIKEEDNGLKREKRDNPQLRKEDNKRKYKEQGQFEETIKKVSLQ